MTKFIALVAMIASLTSIAADKQMKVIYGDDNRVDVFESTNNQYIKLAQSTAAMIPNESLRSGVNEQIDIVGPSMQSRGFCASERFSHQSTAAMCSGFLVHNKYLVTAGHCITSQADCQSNKWVFDYKVANGAEANVSVTAGRVYACKRIVSRTLDSSNQDDYALIELDREVTDRAPLSFRKSGAIKKGDDILVIGHPTGLPTKITDGAQVRTVKDKFFVANLDTYGGNSGSAVFNAKTGLVEGILVRGENDFNYDGSRGCRVSNLCPANGCRGEDVTLITNIKELQNL